MPEASSPSEKAKVKNPSRSGNLRASRYTTLHGERVVKIYSVQEHELTSIGLCNTNVAIWCSVGSGGLSLIGACIWSMTTATDYPSRAAVTFVIFVAIVTIVAFFLACWFHRMKANQIQKIQAETVIPSSDNSGEDPPESEPK